MHVYMCGSTIGVPTTFDRVPKHLQAYFYAHRAIRNGTLTCVICTHFRGPVLLVLKYFRCTRSISIDVITSHPPNSRDMRGGTNALYDLQLRLSCSHAMYPP